MHVARSMAVLSLLALALVSCGSGGGGGDVRVVSINLNPAAVSAGSVVTLSASISAPGQSVSGLVKNWTVTAGLLTVDQPDFSLLLRQTARGVSATSVSTTAGVVYWIPPTDTGSATITCAVANDSQSLDVIVGSSPVTLSVVSGDGGSKICTVAAHGVADLYQAAFRISFTSAWSPAGAEPGDFLGASEDILDLAMLDQNGFVPMAITRKGDVPGVDGSGTLATVTFDPAGTTSSARGAANIPFELSMVILRDSRNQPIATQ
jgi:hypothetical protein